ncbi:MAG: response regulator [Candidatus Omnitrophica bacterium]|nr:response regulator [Candidatus Omnitrophota bacterium]
MGNTVALVDDELMIVKILSLRLERLGYHVVSAHDGKAALEMIRGQRPDVVLLDVRLPLLDGTEVCRQLKNDQSLRRIPVILFSAAEDEENRQMMREYGADDFISKPFETEDLLQKISRYAQPDTAVN